jgi:hypothetical protein
MLPANPDRRLGSIRNYGPRSETVRTMPSFQRHVHTSIDSKYLPIPRKRRRAMPVASKSAGPSFAKQMRRYPPGQRFANYVPARCAIDRSMRCCKYRHNLRRPSPHPSCGSPSIPAALRRAGSNHRLRQSGLTRRTVLDQHENAPTFQESNQVFARMRRERGTRLRDRQSDCQRFHQDRQKPNRERTRDRASVRVEK